MSKFLNHSEPRYDVKNYGVQADNSTDDSAAWGEVISIAAPGPAEFVLEDGISIVDNVSFAAMTGGCKITCAGNGVASLKHKASASDTMLKFGNSITGRVTLTHVTLDGNKANQGTGVKDLISFDGAAGGSISIKDVTVTDWRARAFVLTNTTWVRVRDITSRNAAETLDSELVGGAGLLYMPSHNGYVDIRHWDCVQPALSNNTRAPWGIYLVGTASNTMRGSIGQLTSVRYGHEGATPSTDSRAFVELFNRCDDLVVHGITSHLPAYTAIRSSSSNRTKFEVNIISQNHNFAAPAVLVAAGLNGVSGDTRDNFVTFQSSAFTAGAPVEFRGASVSSYVRGSVAVGTARACLQAVKADWTVGNQYTVGASSCTGTAAGEAAVYFGPECTGQARVLLSSTDNMTHHLHADSAANLYVRLMPGSAILQTAAVAAVTPIRVDGCQTLFVDDANFAGTHLTAIDVTNTTDVALTNNHADAGMGVVSSGITNFRSAGNAWQVATLAHNPASIAANTFGVFLADVALADAALGDAVTVTFSLDSQATQFWGRVDVAGNVKTYQDNSTAGAVDLGAGTLLVRTERG